MSADIEHTEIQCATCLEYQHTQPQERALHYEIPYKLWKVFGADIVMVNNRTLLCTVNYYSKFLIVKNTVSFSADDLVQMAGLIFTECELPKKYLVSDAGTNFT